MSRHTSASTRSKDTEVRVSQTVTDAPLLPIEQISRLRELAPERVDWIFSQTEIESAFRRKEQQRINTMTFIERMSGLVFALLVACLGLGIAAWLATDGRELTASLIGGTTIVGLVSAFILGRDRK